MKFIKINDDIYSIDFLIKYFFIHITILNDINNLIPYIQ
jgi:hypothetical protein